MMKLNVEKTVVYKLELNEEEINTVVCALGELKGDKLKDFSNRNDKKVLTFNGYGDLYRDLGCEIGLF